MKKIEVSSKSVRDALKDRRYFIDYYQREYRWQRKQVQELVEDLTEQFLASYSDRHDREAVQEYGHYFLGSIVLSSRDGKEYVIDGQQRLTTLTLLLILLYRRQGSRPDRVKLEDLIYSEKYGKRSFNISVPERSIVMDSLFKGDAHDATEESESVQTIVARFEDLSELLEDSDLDEHALPYFCDWLIDNVHFVQITTAADEDAYTIFETMNDRGLSLSPLDMLKGYLLSKISDPEKRNLATEAWRDRIESLRRLGKDEDSDAVKTWLRARHAQTVRERRQGSENRDFEQIGTEFHRWVGSNATALGLGNSQGYFRFVHSEMPYYTRHYERMRVAAESPVDGLERVYFVGCFNFSLQYPLLLAPLQPDDDPATVDQKVVLVATFLDILLARRAVNYLTMTYSALNYTMFNIVRDIRGKSVAELGPILFKKLDEQGCDFNGTRDGQRGGVSRFGLNQWSKRYIKVLLARMTAYVESNSGISSSVAKYLGEGKNRFEIEHIVADKPQRYADAFPHSADFAEFRNRFAGLLLVPADFNRSFGALEYEKKLPHYLKQNLLAQSLHTQAYERHPAFLRFIEETGIPFHAHGQFGEVDMDARTDLYRLLMEEIWNPAKLLAYSS